MKKLKENLIKPLKLSRHAAMLFAAKHFDYKARFWRNRDLSVIKDYWESRNDDSNEYLHDLIKKRKPKKILEIGCCCGNRLYGLAKEDPSISLVGIDINREAVDFGNERFKEEGVENVQLLHLRAEELDDFHDSNFDLVFSWATLLYITPQKIRQVLSHIRSISAGMMLLELNLDSGANPNILEEFHVGNWKRDYKRILESFNPAPQKINITPIPPEIWNPGGGGASVIDAVF